MKRLLRVLAAAVALAVPLGGAAALAAPVAPAAAAAPGPPTAPQYWFDTWQVSQLWADGARGQGVVIAEIDTGVNAAIPELAGKVVPGKDFGASGGDGTVDRDSTDYGHGTAMASIMVAEPGLLGITGLAPDARVMPIAVPLTGTTDASAEDHLADAIRWAADHGAKIISMSLGGARSPADGTAPCPVAEQQAIYYALSKGVVLLASAGNRGEEDNAVEEPGVCLGVLTVGAVNPDGTVASFSSRHPYLAFTAPGMGIATLSRIPGSAYNSRGTSQATALAAAAVALVWSKFPQATGAEIVTRVLATLDDHRATPDPAYGYGRINPSRAVNSTVPADAPNPIYAAAAPFLERYRAFLEQADPTPPPPAAKSRGATGTFSVTSSSVLSDPEVVGGFAAAIGGLILLVALAMWALVVRNRRRGPGAPVTRRGAAPAAPAAPPMVDDAGVVWHQIISPTDPAGPAAPTGASAPKRTPRPSADPAGE